jgi:hypothetical protein
VKVEVLYFDGCPGYAEVLPRVRQLVGGRAEVELRPIGRTDYGMKCRLYRTDEGQQHAPPDAWIRRALEGET